MPEAKTLWLVTAEWVDTVCHGKTDSVVQAPDAVKALQLFWQAGDVKSLREVTIKWLGPTDCVVCDAGMKLTTVKEEDD